MHFDEFLPEGGLFLFLLQLITDLPEVIDLFVEHFCILGLERQLVVFPFQLIVIQEFPVGHELEFLIFLYQLVNFVLFLL